MIEIAKGDILEADAEALVNTVNCVGVMGRGIALQFKRAFPENFRAYRACCDQGNLQPGTMLIHDLHSFVNPHYIINFPTKRHWKGRSQIEDIEIGLHALTKEIERLGIRSVAIPPLGCGLGGLPWDAVRPRIERAFATLPGVRVLLYAPEGAPAANAMARTTAAPKMTLGRAALVGLIGRYLAGVMDPTVSLLEIHKLMYFMQEAGEELKLRYEKARYGPYAANLRHVLSHIEGHFISGFGDGADDPARQIELLPDALSRAEACLNAHPRTRERFERVANLIQGFETPFGLELLATVHWVSCHEAAKDLATVRARTYAWNERKQMFEPDQIQVAWEVLLEKKWIAT